MQIAFSLIYSIYSLLANFVHKQHSLWCLMVWVVVLAQKVAAQWHYESFPGFLRCVRASVMGGPSVEIEEGRKRSSTIKKNTKYHVFKYEVLYEGHTVGRRIHF